MVLFKKIIYTDCPTAGSTAGRMLAGRAGTALLPYGREEGGLRKESFES